MARNLEKLLAFIEARAARPFDWRGNDCVSFAAGAVRAQTGRRLLGTLRWRTKAHAAQLIADQGGLEAAVDARLTRIPPAQAMRGDVAGVVDPLFGIRLMIVEGATLVGPGARGLKRMPRAAMAMAWSVEAANV